ncbi:MAG: hypothetical protein A2V98_00465 [Planctomycetes bacterium RBG_16_64_12]|nr:MAG: hypothetical protein A2V98_00465 [Planctomycetes bacterium RBG_16_64_12]
MGPPVAKLVKYFDACRRKRNLVDYNLAHVVTETELDELLEKAAEFRTMIEDCIAKNHPQLAARSLPARPKGPLRNRRSSS